MFILISGGDNMSPPLTIKKPRKRRVFRGGGSSVGMIQNLLRFQKKPAVLKLSRWNYHLDIFQKFWWCCHA